jgi:acyl-CoA carboxylase subunit beta
VGKRRTSKRPQAPSRLGPRDYFALLLGADFQVIDEAPEAIVVAEGCLDGHDVVCAAGDFGFLGGSLGIVAGSRLARALERGAGKAGVIAVAQSGGVRVLEGSPALLQMTHVVAARQLLAEARRPLITVVTDPTFGGLAVSIAGTADVVLAEPGARLGFTGPRAAAALGGVEARVDTAESALAAGFVDAIVPRRGLKNACARLLRILVAARIGGGSR